MKYLYIAKDTFEHPDHKGDSFFVEKGTIILSRKALIQERILALFLQETEGQNYRQILKSFDPGEIKNLPIKKLRSPWLEVGSMYRILPVISRDYIWPIGFDEDSLFAVLEYNGKGSFKILNLSNNEITTQVLDSKRIDLIYRLRKM